jgi:hypothetical protein
MLYIYSPKAISYSFSRKLKTKMDKRAPPIIDFSRMTPFANLHRTWLIRYNVAFYGTDATKKQELADQVRSACLAKGFFQITNHGIPEELQDAVFEQSRAFFSLPLEEKMRTSLSQYDSNPISGPVRLKDLKCRIKPPQPRLRVHPLAVLRKGQSRGFERGILPRPPSSERPSSSRGKEVQYGPEPVPGFSQRSREVSDGGG